MPGRAGWTIVIPDENRFESDPDAALGDVSGLPKGWRVGTPDPVFPRLG